MSTTKFIISLLLIVPLLTAARHAKAKTYPIKLSRPSFVGEKGLLNIDLNTSDLTTVSNNGQIINRVNKNITGQLEAKLEVLEVNKMKNASKVLLTINTANFNLTNNATKQNEALTLENGTEVLVYVENGKNFYTINNQAPSAQFQEILSKAYTLKTTDVSDDAVFGSDKAQAISAKWPINSELAAQDLSKEDMTVSAENLQGQTRLVKKTIFNDTECLVISAQFTIKDFELPMPPTMNVEHLEATTTFSGHFPTDLNKPSLSYDFDFIMEFKATGQFQEGGPIMTVHSKSINKKTSIYKPFK